MSLKSYFHCLFGFTFLITGIKIAIFSATVSGGVAIAAVVLAAIILVSSTNSFVVAWRAYYD